MSRENANTKNIITGCLCALGAETFYGFSFIFTRQAVNFASAFALLGWRFFIAFVVMLTLVLTGVVKTDLKKKKLGPLLLMALLFPTIYFTGETLGIKLTTATESGVFIAAIPITAIIASSLILKKKPFRRQVAGILVTMAGVAITIFAVGTSASFSPAGYMFLVLAVVSYSLYCVMVEKHTEYTGAEITFVILTFGAAAFGIIAMVEAGASGSIPALLTLPFREPAFLAAVLYLGIGSSVCAFFLNNIALAKIGVNRSSSFAGVGTVVTVLAGTFLLGEPFSAAQIVGAAVIIAGVYIANVSLGKKTE